MKSNIATQYFEKLFEATFDNARVYVAGLTGNPDIIEDVLFKTYKEIFKQLQKQKNFDGDKIGEMFYGLLKKYAAECDNTQNDTPVNFIEKTEQDIKDILATEFNLTEEQAKDELLIKKSHTYLFQKPAIERKAFVLYFYEGCSPEEIADMFSIKKEYVCGCIYSILQQIKNNFLGTYQG